MRRIFAAFFMVFDLFSITHIDEFIKNLYGLTNGFSDSPMGNILHNLLKSLKICAFCSLGAMEKSYLLSIV